jgi:simple sugar transport system ATP-binding protein
VGVVHQHFMLVETMTVAENVALGQEPRRGPFGLLFDRRRARDEVRALGERYGLRVDPDARVEALAVGERQRVELLKVLYRGARYVLLDEPTAVLSPGEIHGLLEVIRGLAAGGAGVVFVSHKLDEVLAVAHEVTVLRRGRVVLAKPRGETDAAELARAVMGGEVPEEPPRRARLEGGRAGLSLERVRAPGLREVSLTVAAGEVVGVAGVEGNGQRALAHAIAGLLELEGGRVCIGGEDAAGWSIAARRARGLGYVPEDREGTGLLGALSIAENLALGNAEVATGRGWLALGALREQARAVISRYGVRPADPDAPVASLSGGNAQKVLIARELGRSLRALVVAQPTRGVDLGAAVEVRAAIRRARDEGVAVLLVTSDLDELRALADRVVVMRAGALVGEMSVDEATDARLGPLMVGGA